MLKIYCDTSSLKKIKEIIKKTNISGITTNPSIMRSDGVKNYKNQCIKILKLIKKRSLSAEIFSNKKSIILDQAKKISSWAKNIYVKIPIVNTDGTYLTDVISILNKNKINVNITAVFTERQLIKIKKSISKKNNVIISVFCGRIADSGVNPENIIRKSISMFKNYKKVKILWASTRELYNYYQAKKLGCHIITMPPSLIEKLLTKKTSLQNSSVNTVKQFYHDGKKSKFHI